MKLKKQFSSLGKLLTIGLEKLALIASLVIVFAFGFFSEGGLVAEAQRLARIEKVSETVFTVAVLALGVFVFISIGKMIVNYKKEDK